ncbi:MAG: glycosyltransferase family 2 protein [Acidobacteriaceae bacterium]|nr:glycosyltransferase family 2 protein [Acidobacteriaceae bacterium]
MLTIVVPVYNGGWQLANCLNALGASSYRDFELLVVDDCSSDHSVSAIQSHKVRYFRTPRREGPAGARNLGASAARGDILVFVDADVQVPPDALGIIAEDFERDPQLQAVFGSYDHEPSAQGFFSHYKNLFHHYIHQTSSENATTFWAGCGAIRRDVFEKIGGFDAERYARPAIEDIELGLRLVQRGHKILLDKRLQVKHLKRWTLLGMIKSDVRDRAVPWSKLVLEIGTMPRDLNLTYSARFSAAGVLLLPPMLLLMPWGHSARGSMMLASSVFFLVVLLLALNYRVYQFFWEKRGFAFAVAAVPTHWLYYFYSGLTWAYCCAAHFISALRTPPPAVAVISGVQVDREMKRSLTSSQME